MASWLKAAEDLFEVVDRKAKLVVNEIADERQQTVSNGPVSQTKRKKAKPKPKVQKKLSLDESPKVGDDKEDVSDRPILQSDVVVKDRVAPSVENEGSAVGNFDVQTSPEQNHGVDGNRPNIHSSEGQAKEEVKQDLADEEVPVLASEVEVTTFPSKSEVLNDKAIDVQHPIPASPAKEIEVPEEEHRISSGENQSGETEVFPKIEQEKSESGGIETSVNSGPPAKDVVSVIEPFANQKKQEEPKADRSLAKIQDQSQIDQKKQEEPKADRSLAKIQDQLEEAQGLLKTTASTGQSKEARLARVCAGLSTRLQEYKSENAQLEELLVAERELSKSYETCIQQLQQDLSLSKSEVTRVESGMLEALAAKNSEIEALVGSLETLKKQAALSEGNMASLQANMESIMRNRELTETRMMQAVREELSSAERRAEEERAAHNATKMAAMERERELEHRAVEASTALARIQRTADERTAKAIELEQKVALLEVECSSLNQELQDMEAQVRRGLKKSADEANQVIQTQAWQEEVERARQGQRDAESKLSSLEAEVLKTRVEMAAMKRDAEHYSRQEHVELEKRYRELTDLLYHKQTQLEAMASEKAAVEFQLEKEVKRLQEAQSEAERSKVPRHSSTSWEDDTEMKTLETLPLYQRHMVGVSIQLQKAAKMLDTGAARATRFLWRYPTARLILLLYLVFVHLFLMYLLHRLQERDDVSSTNLTLP